MSPSDTTEIANVRDHSNTADIGTLLDRLHCLGRSEGDGTTVYVRAGDRLYRIAAVGQEWINGDPDGHITEADESVPVVTLLVAGGPLEMLGAPGSEDDPVSGRESANRMPESTVDWRVYVALGQLEDRDTTHATAITIADLVAATGLSDWEIADILHHGPLHRFGLVRRHTNRRGISSYTTVKPRRVP